MKDILGTEIDIGDWVIRAYTPYRSPELKFGRVLDFKNTDSVKVIGIKRTASVDGNIGSVSGKDCLFLPDSWVPQEIKDAYNVWRAKRKNDYPI